MNKISGYLRLLVFITATMPFWSLGHALWEVDDARYAEVPREMAETADWLTPRLNYIDYIQKPPLIYWMTAASYKIFGVSEASSRVPLALLSLLGLLGAAWLGAWLFSPETGIWAAVILGSCAEFSLLEHLHTPDMALAVFLLWSTAFILRCLRRPEDCAWAGPAAGAAMGLAFLSKGLVAWLFPGAWACSLLILFPELRKSLRPCAWLGAPAAALLIAGPWLWAMSSSQPGFLRHFFIEQHFLRYLTPEYNRPGPWHYFIGVEAAGLLPWSPLVLAALGLTAAGWRRAETAERQLLLWVGLVFLFFSASHSKLPTYILPLFPQQCLIGARLIEKLNVRKERLAWLDRMHRVSGLLAWAAGPIALYVLARLQPPGLPPISREFLAAGGGLLFLLGAGWVYPKFLPWSAFFMTETILIGAQWAQPWLSAKALAQDVRAYCRLEDPLIAYGLYLHGIPFYARRRVDRVVNWVGELDYGKSLPRFQDRFGDDDAIRRLGSSGGGACVVLSKREQAAFAGLLPKGRLSAVIGRGPWALAIIGRPPQ